MNDYNIYQLNKKELLIYGGGGYVGGFLLILLFFGSPVFSAVVGVGAAILFLKFIKKNKAEKQKKTLVVEFKDACDSFVSALSAGYSMENSVTEAKKDLLLLYKKETSMISELDHISQRLTPWNPIT